MANRFGHRIGHGQVDSGALALPLYVRDLRPTCTTRGGVAPPSVIVIDVNTPLLFLRIRSLPSGWISVDLYRRLTCSYCATSPL